MQAFTLLGMSGVGKTTLSNKLARHKWFHYSGDYRIATYYLRDQIGDFLKSELKCSPILASLFKRNALSIKPKLDIDNLSAVSAYVSKIGRPDLGGLDLSTFLERQRQYCKAELSAVYDVGYFKEKAKNVYHYDCFMFDAGGSICELDDENVIRYLAKETTVVYIHADETLEAELIQRAINFPKPLYYNETFLLKSLKDYGTIHRIENEVDIVPDDFIRFVIPKLMQHRAERYHKMVSSYGIIIDANEMARVGDENDFIALVNESKK